MVQSPKNKEKRIIIIKKKEEYLSQVRGHAARILIRGYAARRALRP